MTAQWEKNWLALKKERDLDNLGLLWQETNTIQRCMEEYSFTSILIKLIMNSGNERSSNGVITSFGAHSFL